MDLFMDIDSDDILEGNPVCTFLSQRLKNLRDANQQLRTTIEHSKRTIEEDSTAAKSNVDDGGLIVGAVCKRYHNGKWCFIVDVSSSDPTITYTDFDVALKWSPIISAQHTLMTYSSDAKSFVTSAQIATKMRVIVAFESIAFAYEDKYVADAVFLYSAHANPHPADTKSARNRPRRALTLGAFSMSVEEMNSGAHEIKNAHLINASVDAVLAALACSVQITLAITQPMGALKDYLVIDCMCRDFEFDNRMYFLLCADAPHLRGCLITYIEEDGVYLATFYARDREHLGNVVRHMHLSIRGVQILPLKCKALLKKNKQAEDEEIFSSQTCMQSQQPAPIDEGVKKFGECLLQQIDSVIDFHRNVVGNKNIPAECDVSEEYLGMRNSLTQLEATTDFYHQQFIA